MSQYRIRISRHSAGLDDMKRKDQGDHLAVLRRLSTMTRYSVFEATENQKIAKTMDYIMRMAFIESTGGTYPWTEFRLTDAGKAAIA